MIVAGGSWLEALLAGALFAAPMVALVLFMFGAFDRFINR